MKKILSLIAFSIITFTTVWGQINTLYFNKNIYQSTVLNPARQHNCRFSFGLPALSSIYLNTKHTGFDYEDWFFDNPNKPDSARFDILIDETYDKMGDLNYVFLHNKTSLGYVAFWIRDFYITLGADFNVQQNFTYPKSFFLLKDGNYFEDENKYISLTGLSEDVNIYTAYSIGVSKEVTPGLTIGGKIKLLKGIANITTENFQFDWHVMTDDTATYDYRFNTAFDIKTAGLFNANFNEDGDFTNLQSVDKYNNISTANDIFDIMKNNGFAIDFGVIYKPSEKFEISASVLDFGFITWQTDVVTLNTQESEFLYSGFDLSKYVGGLSDAMALIGDQEAQDSAFSQIQKDMIDTLLFLSNPTIDSTKYKTNLNTRLHFGGAYSPADWVTIGFLYNGYFYHKKLISSGTASATLMFWKGWSYSLSYTMFKHSFNNIGMGLSYKIGPFQTYFLFENLSIPMLGARYGLSPDKPYNEGIATKWYKNSKLFNFQFGINFMFGCRDRRDYGILD